MNTVFTFPLRLFSFVLSSSLMSVVLIFLILAAKNIFKHKQGAKWHYFIWFILIFRMILPWAPESSFSVFNIFSFEKQNSVVQTAEAENNNIQVEVEKGTSVEAAINESILNAKTDSENFNQSVTLHDYVNKFNIDLNMLYWLWLGAAIVIGLYAVLNGIVFEIKLKKYKSNVDKEIFSIFWNCKCKLNIQRNIPLIETPYVKSPTLVGFLNPRILLPVNVIEAIPIEQLNYVFIHELVHYKRKDIGINLLTSIILIFHWFNPVLWYAFYKMREDQEISCDALALTYINQNEIKEYALTLIKLLESFIRFQKLPGAAGIGGSKFQIRKRIKMIKYYKKSSLKWSVVGFVFVIALSLISLTNPKAGFLNTSALAGEINSTPNDEASAIWLDDYSFRPANQDEKSIAYIISNYMNAVGNADYRTMTGKEGFEYLTPTSQAQANVWVEDTLFKFKKNKLIYGVNEIDIEFIFIGSEEAAACLTGKISRISNSNELRNVYENSFKALFTLKKSDGKWQIVAAPYNDNLAEMLIFPSYEEAAIKKTVNEYVNNTFTNVNSITVYIPPVTNSMEETYVKCMLRMEKAIDMDDLKVTCFEKEFKLKKIDNNWVIVNN